MAKKWNKIIARLEALEEALAGLLSGRKSKKRKRKSKKAKAKKPSRRKKGKKATPGRGVPARKRTAKTKSPRRVRRSRGTEAVVVAPPLPLATL